MTQPVVLLVHEWLGPVVWGDVVAALGEDVRAEVPDLVPPRSFQPGALDAGIHAQLPRVAPERTDLVVATGYAAGAGADLVVRGRAAHALLVEPDLTEVLFEPGVSERPDDSARRRLHEGIAVLETLAPHAEQLRTGGTLPPEAVERFAAASAAPLPEPQRDFLEAEFRRRVNQMLPTDPDHRFAPAPRWTGALARVPERVTVAVGAGRPLAAHYEAGVSRRGGRDVLHLAGTPGCPWLDDPAHFAGRVRAVLTRACG